MDSAPTVEDDADALVAALRRRSEPAFVRLVEQYQGSLIRVACTYVSDRAIAQEVVQETWIGVFEGIDRFEARSSFRTWLFRILVNKAQRRGVQERRTIPFSAFQNDDADLFEPAVDPSRFRGPGDKWSGGWVAYPEPWESSLEEQLISAEGHARLESIIAGLPDSYRRVLTLRDIEGWSPEEVCKLLDLSEGNQRVILHRARSRVRRAIELEQAGG